MMAPTTSEHESDQTTSSDDKPGCSSPPGSPPPSSEESNEPPVPLNLDTIPVEVLLQIFNFVDATDLLRNVSLVSKYFHTILSNEMTWKIKMEKRWGGTGESKYPPVDLLPNDSPSKATPYTKIFTTSRFPWSKACVKREEQIKLWSNPTQKLSHATLSSHIGCIDSIHLFSRNDTMLLTCGSRDRSISIWNVHQVLEHVDDSESRIKILHRAHDGWIWDFAVNSSNLFSCSWDTTAKLWDFSTLQVVSQFKSNTALLSISTTETLTAIGAFNRKILLLDPRAPTTPTNTLTSHSRSVLSLGLDSTYLISCGEDGLTCRHDLRTLKLESKLKLPPTDTSKTPYPTCTSFRDTLISAPYFYVGDNTGSIHLISLLSFKIINSTKLHNAPVRGVFNNLGSVVSCSRDGKLVVSSANLGLKQLGTVDVGDKIELPCVHSLDNVVACGGGDGVVRVWGCTTGVL